MKNNNYTGVRYSSRTKKFHAKVTHNNVVYNCGGFDTEVEAAKARDRKIIEKNLPAKLQVYKKVKK